MEGGVADMMVTVFNSPMATSETHKVFRGRSILGQAGQSKGVIIADLTALSVDGDALDQEGPTQMGEVDAGLLGGDGDFTVFKTAMGDIGGVSAEGENPPKGGIPDGCEVFAGCF